MVFRRLFALAVLCPGLIASALAEPALVEPTTLTQPAREVLERLMPALAPQFTLALTPAQQDGFHITGTAGHIRVEAATTPTLLYGVNWYLKYVAHLQVSTNGLQLGAPGLILPAPPAPIDKPALYPWRYALNENVDGYSAPYWDDVRWQREIDILAMSGINAVLIERGTDLVLYETFRDAGYSDDEIRRWITQPAHQNWQLMGNMCCFNEPISLELLHKRAESAKHIIASLRRLGIAPVLPGYYGIVPADFGTRHPGAHVIPQGEWNGFTRPGWLDPRDSDKKNPWFAKLAASFYRHQSELFGAAPLYDINIFQEGGTAGDVPEGAGAKAVQDALERSHPKTKTYPGAIWFMMAWQREPSAALLSELDTTRILIADIEQGRTPRENRDEEFRHAPWLFGGLWEFGGRTTLGAPLYDYAVRLPVDAAKPGSGIRGIAYFTEGVDTNPAAFDLYTEMAWHKEPVDIERWFAEYAQRRYGANDLHAVRAWQIILHTIYSYRADGVNGQGERDAAADSIFNAQPSLDARHAAGPSPEELRYQAADLTPALTELLQVAPELRSTSTYQYDLVDISRQVLVNSARTLLPEIKTAYEHKDKPAFDRLTAEWLHRMELEDALLATNQWFLLGRWLSWVPQWASTPEELARLHFDARSILTTWGDRKASDEGGLHEYADKDWSGLVSSYYRPRWKMYFDSLDASLESGQPAKPIDWFAFGEQWNHANESFPDQPHGDAYQQATEVARTLHLLP
ncbi:alpha-N-acetylglucosaminidase [Silvibacterium sp.]|uniref:alpha-N-acetylglucosaminidase n=1 Tax=Silvibacterium sp. TaxID=1964179 RepID=UPI0039E67F70